MIPDQKIAEWYKLAIKSPDLDRIKTASLRPPVAAFIRNASRVGVFSWILTSNITFDFSKGVAEELWERSRLHSDEEKEGFDTLMSAQLVLAWTAFETLAGDLWEAAINLHHPTLVQKAAEGKSIQIRLLFEKHGFDLRNKMGTVLLDHLDRPFQSMKSMKKTYQSTFPDGWVSQDSFWDDKDLRSTCSLRNLIVHKASIVDKKFLEDGKDDGRLLVFKEGHRFYLNGELLAELLTGLFAFSERLIQAVDGWIDRNAVSVTE